MANEQSNPRKEVQIMVRVEQCYSEEARTSNTFCSLDVVVALVKFNEGFLQSLTDCVEKYVDQCGRRWVDLNGLFSFMKV